MIKILFRTVLILFAVASPFVGKAQYNSIATSRLSAQILFIENSWTEALKQASAQKKYIFVDAYTSWCGPCKMLKSTTFKNNRVVDFYNKNFVNLSIDMEKGQGPKLAAQWALQAVPTLMIFDSKGNPVLQTVGFIKPDDLIKFGTQALHK